MASDISGGDFVTPSSPRTTAADPPVTTAASANSTVTGSGADFFGTASGGFSPVSLLEEATQLSVSVSAVSSASQPKGGATAASSIPGDVSQPNLLPGFPPMMPPRCLGAVTRTTNTTVASDRPRLSLGGATSSHTAFTSASVASSAATFASVIGPPRRHLAPPVAQPGMPVPTHQGRKWTVLADIKTIKPNHTREERSAFVLKDLGVPPTSLAAAYVLHVDQMFLISLRDEATYEAVLERLTRGVPWAAAGGRRVFGHSTLDLCLNVRVDNVPFNVPLAVITGALEDFGLVITTKRGVFPGTVDAADGIVHCRMRLHPGATLPDFIALELEGQVLDEVCRVMTDVHVRRCFKCGQANHIGMACRMAAKTITQQGAVWTKARYVEDDPQRQPPQFTAAPTGQRPPLSLPQVRQGPPLAARALLPGGTTVLRLLGQNKGPEEGAADLQRVQLNNTVEVPTRSRGGEAAATEAIVSQQSLGPPRSPRGKGERRNRGTVSRGAASRSPSIRGDPDYVPGSSRSSQSPSLQLRLSASQGTEKVGIGKKAPGGKFYLQTQDSDRIEDGSSGDTDSESVMDQTPDWSQVTRRASKRRAAKEARDSRKVRQRTTITPTKPVKKASRSASSRPPPVLGARHRQQPADNVTDDSVTSVPGSPSRE